MRMHLAPTTTHPTVAVYVSGPAGTDLDPFLAACRDYASGRGWRVSAELTDEREATSRAPRPGWRAAKRFVVTGLARGIVTYAPPMVVSRGTESYSDVLDWVEGRAAFLATVWRPYEKAVVRDSVAERTGTVIAVDAVGGVAWLRATGGGRYWTTVPEALEPVGAEPRS
ncbi:hypothetical protein ACQEVS_22165 [Streptomyces sp. CA-181903]|uniref:hypothetical protein n=1 Tax=Streptomyces sp. CA-181903 TaxID=3240055 RepID=UPI003D92569A